MKRAKCIDCGRRKPRSHMRRMLEPEKHLYSCRVRYLCVSQASYSPAKYASHGVNP